MSVIGGTMSIVGGTTSIVGGTMSIIGGTMSNGHEVVEPYKEPWTKFMENDHFGGGTMMNVYGTMDNFDGIVNIGI